MTDSRPTNALAITTSTGLDDDDASTRAGPDLAAAMIAVAAAELRFEVEGTSASERAKTRARARLRSLFAADGPHGADRLIGALRPTSREVSTATAHPEIMGTLAESKASAIAMVTEAGIATTRGMLGTTLAARLQALGAGQLADATATGDADAQRGAAYLLATADAMLDRAREADRAIRAEQRAEAARREWEQRSSALTVAAAAPLQSVDADDRKSIYDAPPSDEETALERARNTIGRLQGRKVELGLAFVDPRDDSVTIRPRSKPHPRAAIDGPKLRRAAAGTTPPPSPARRLSASELAERGIYSDSVIDSHPMAIAEAALQAAEREAREREFPKGTGRLSGVVPEWRPQYREPEPAPWEQLAQLRVREAEDDDDDHDDDDTDGSEDAP